MDGWKTFKIDLQDMLCENVNCFSERSKIFGVILITWANTPAYFCETWSFMLKKNKCCVHSIMGCTGICLGLKRK